MATRILSLDILSDFLKNLNENSPLLAASMLFGFGIAITALEQVSRQNGYAVAGDSFKPIDTMVKVNFACLAALMISTGIAFKENSAFFALATMSLVGAFWSIHQIIQINSSSDESSIKSDIDFPAKRTLLGLVAIIGAPFFIAGSIALNYSISQKV
jgi:hypothetical protein